ncbi:hypothetical protein CRG98_046261 [Punica granatum]|uniref:Uncharacterized protein n=1 Tax=Punica granatum TaxID=22663 RepID=A0A2I0HNT5_PUNGR|nr:hypothetical protein CRG98_046261 [Punica granatum]
MGFQLIEEEEDAGPSVASVLFSLEPSNIMRVTELVIINPLVVIHHFIDVPWKALFRTPAVWAMIYAHFVGSWGPKNLSKCRILASAACMTLSSIDLRLELWEVIGILTGGFALSSFAFGIKNAVGAVPGIIGVVLSAFLLDATYSWSEGEHLSPAIILQDGQKSLATLFPPFGANIFDAVSASSCSSAFRLGI